MKKIGFTHGRFQPFHLGHLEVMKYILDKYKELWVGISNPLLMLPENIDEIDQDLRESILKARDPKKNIFTYLERSEMILGALREEGYDVCRVRIIPHFGYYEYPNWKDFIPPIDNMVVVLHAKDVHHNKKIQLYKENKFEIEELPLLVSGVSGTFFHQEFPNGNWRELVPKSTEMVIEKSHFIN